MAGSYLTAICLLVESECTLSEHKVGWALLDSSGYIRKQYMFCKLDEYIVHISGTDVDIVRAMIAHGLFQLQMLLY